MPVVSSKRLRIWASRRRPTLQKLATDALADFQAIEQAGTATPEALLDAWLDVVDKIDKGAFKTLPEGFQASASV